MGNYGKKKRRQTANAVHRSPHMDREAVTAVLIATTGHMREMAVFSRQPFVGTCEIWSSLTSRVEAVIKRMQRVNYKCRVPIWMLISRIRRPLFVALDRCNVRP